MIKFARVVLALMVGIGSAAQGMCSIPKQLAWRCAVCGLCARQSLKHPPAVVLPPVGGGMLVDYRRMTQRELVRILMLRSAQMQVSASASGGVSGAEHQKRNGLTEE